MENFTPWASLSGGILIGLAATGMLLFNGRITGISGILSQCFFSRDNRVWRMMFLVGLLLAGSAYRIILGDAFSISIQTPTTQLIAAGLLVGFGTRLGSGCTSGHGICGLARFSPRSFVATLIFMFFGMLTVWAVHQLRGGI
jgi:uncharacterized membrane protein YedE/YeeE